MNVYIVFYYDGYEEAWLVNNVYYHYADAKKQAELYNGYVLTREVL